MTTTLILFSVLVAMTMATSLVCAEDDGVIRHTKNQPTSIAAPLTPSLQCSACEVTAREVHWQYSKRSVHDKFYATEVEFADVLEKSCEQITPMAYYLAQENFGARLKVFAKKGLYDDIQNTERVEFYSARDEARYVNAVHRLRKFCEAFVEKFYTTHFIGHVVQRTEEATLRNEMCNKNATSLCENDTLLPYRKIEERKRRRWKKLVADAKMEAKLAQELNEKRSAAGEQEELDLASTTEL